MFGCVIDTFGYRNEFTQVSDTVMTMQIPSPWLINYISVFTTDPTMLAGGAAQVLIETNGVTELLGFLSDFKPSITVLSPKHLLAQATPEVKQSAFTQIIIQATALENVVDKDIYQPSLEECNMVDYQAQRLVNHFHESLNKYVITDNNGNVFIPLGQVEAWAKRYKNYLQYNY